MSLQEPPEVSNQPQTTDEGPSVATKPAEATLDEAPSKAALLKKVALSPLSILSLLPFPSLQQILLHTLSLGPIPRHIAFVMDGNRRWARTSSHTVREGHLTGFATLKKVLEVCLNLRGLDTVTVYAFAIDNFRRSESEVQALMEIARTRLIELAGHGELIARYQVRVRIVGRKELLPKDVQEAVERVENMTRGNSKATLNICMPYASRDEIAGAARKVLDQRLRMMEKAAIRRTKYQLSTSAALDNPREQDSLATASSSIDSSASRHSLNSLSSSQYAVGSSDAPLASSDTIEKDLLSITPTDLDEHMQHSHSPPLDILVRTSGVSRLSDFMLWQCNHNTQLHFVNKYWPQFGLLDMVPIILDWQRDQWARNLRRNCGWDQ